MRVIADLHLHSKYSRACSKELTLPNIDLWCSYKGIGVAVTSDFTHPAWWKHIKDELKVNENGLLERKEGSHGTQFFLGTELSCIYKKNDAVRRIHMLVFMPDLQAAEQLNKYLDSIGNIKADGRPILGLDVKELTKRVLGISKDAFVIPAHAWTPWFAIFGSKSGFDTLEECFEEETKNIFAIETGLSSDPAMNRMLTKLDNITLISNSDAHSLPNMGREANVFELKKISYRSIRDAIKKGDPNEFLYTIEFFPEEGKYHFDGHAKCNINFHPRETKKHKEICPQCGKKLVIGVMNRVDKLSDRKKANMTGKVPFKNVIPLQEIIAETLGKGKNTKTVQTEYMNIVKNLSNEFYVLLDATEKELNNVTTLNITHAIMRVRNGDVEITPGYDGIYGKIKIFNESEIKKKKQSKLL